MNPSNQLQRSKSDTSDSYKRRRDDHLEDLVNSIVQGPFVISRSVSENVKHALSPPTQKRICNNSISNDRSTVYESTFFPNEHGGSFGLEEVPPVAHPRLIVKKYANQDNDWTLEINYECRNKTLPLEALKSVRLEIWE